MFHGDLRSLHLPLVCGIRTHAKDRGFTFLGGGIQQGGDEAARMQRVVVNKLGQRVEAIVRRHEILECEMIILFFRDLGKISYTR